MQQFYFSYLSFNQSVQIEKYFRDNKLLLYYFTFLLSIHFAQWFMTSNVLCCSKKISFIALKVKWGFLGI